MATTTYGSPNTTRSNPALWWGIGIAAVIALIIFLTMRNSPTDTTVAPTTTGESTTTTTGEGAAGTTDTGAAMGTTRGTGTATGAGTGTATGSATGTGTGTTDTNAPAARMGSETNTDANGVGTGVNTNDKMDRNVNPDPNVGSGTTGPDSNPASRGTTGQ
ncbi:MAG: hypothetical protein HC883_00710 [Bdellovibrionaceae bacterium]|nr:hypothetical protein [Pseudobdellovibrionaceae bacterium]